MSFVRTCPDLPSPQQNPPHITFAVSKYALSGIRNPDVYQHVKSIFHLVCYCHRCNQPTLINPHCFLLANPAQRKSPDQRTLQTKNPDIFLVYSTSRQYVGEYAGNMPAIVPNSLDSHYSQSNNRSTSNISRIYWSPYIREESYMFEYTDTLSVCQDTRYREYTGFFICREYID